MFGDTLAGRAGSSGGRSLETEKKGPATRAPPGPDVHARVSRSWICIGTTLGWRLSPVPSNRNAQPRDRRTVAGDRPPALMRASLTTLAYGRSVEGCRARVCLSAPLDAPDRGAWWPSGARCLTWWSTIHVESLLSTTQKPPFCAIHRASHRAVFNGSRGLGSPGRERPRPASGAAHRTSRFGPLERRYTRHEILSISRVRNAPTPRRVPARAASSPATLPPARAGSRAGAHAGPRLPPSLCGGD